MVFSSSHEWMGEFNHKEGWVLKNWCFRTVELEKTLESPLDCKEIKPVNPKGKQPWIFIERTEAKAEVPIFWPPDAKSWLTGRLWCWERLKAKGEGGRRRWDGWMTSPTQGTQIFLIIYFFTLQYCIGFAIHWHESAMGVTCVPHSKPLSHLLPHPIPLGHPSAPAPSILYPASNLDWRFVSHMIIYMFQCYSLKSSHPHLLPQSPKDCSIHLCLFCCLTYRAIITIFLNSIYMS